MNPSICYFYDDNIGNYHYGHGHPMKPLRVRLTHDLLEAYDLTSKLHRMLPVMPQPEKMSTFHADDYVNFLQSVTTANTDDFRDSLYRFNVGEDCPVFDGLWEYCQSYTGASICGAQKLASGEFQYAVNWAGGMHHGKKHEASGFCYINDCVLAILELLKYYERVMYIDIDVHHGDGVEEAFYTSSRVMTVSFHKFGDFFPGTGHIDDIGAYNGTGYSVNVPLLDGVDDTSFEYLFNEVLSIVMDRFQPNAVVIQCGADSLSGDKLGCFNLSLNGHSIAVRYLRNKSIPLLILGGGGYTLRNVPKCWTYETAMLAGIDLSLDIPQTSEFLHYYAPDYSLGVRNSNMKNLNNKKYLDNLICQVTEHLRNRVFPCGVQISSVEPPPENMKTQYESAFEATDPDGNTDKDNESDIY